MMQATPFKQDLVCANFNLLEVAVHYPTQTLRYVVTGQVILQWLIYRKQGRFPAVDHLELMLVIWNEATLRGDRLDGCERIVQNAAKAP